MPDLASLLDLPADQGAATLALDRLATFASAWEAWRTALEDAGRSGKEREVAGGSTPVATSTPALPPAPVDQPDGTAAAEPTALPPVPDPLHRLRTGSRRLRTALSSYRTWLAARGVRRLRGDLREVMDATSPARDLDVQLAWLERHASEAPAPAAPGVEWVIERLTRWRDRAHATLEESTSPVDLARARERLTARTSVVSPAPTLARVLAAALRTRADALGEDLAGVLSLADRERAHRARIHGKRLRYLLEPFAASLEAETLVARLTKLQDDLGELRDAQVLAEVLTRLLRKAKPVAVDGVKWLLERLGEREVEAWHAVVREWLEPAGADVVFGARQVAARLEARGAAGLPLEIERKYLLSTLPPTAESAPWIDIRQGYLPGKVIVERLRLARDGDGDRYYRTVKTGRGVARVELEEEIDGRLFEALWPLTEGRRLEKRRHRVPDGDLVWEIDTFTDRPLVLAEVELPNEALEPAIPFWLRPFLLREVTGVPEYFNSSLAK